MAFTFAQIIAINDNGTASHGQQYTDVRGNVYVGNADGTFTLVKKTEIIPFTQGNASYLVLGISPILENERQASGSADIFITDQGPKKKAIFALTTTGVTSGVYGSATQIPQLTVDAKGRITNATNITLSGIPPGGAAGGDLSGMFPDPTVAKINGNALGITTPTAGNILVGNGTAWDSVTVSGDASLSSAGVVTFPIVNGDVGVFGNATHVPQLTVNAKGLIIAVTDILISGTSPGGAAGGDLSGFYPNPVVAQINTVPLGSTIATDKNILIANGTHWISRTASGDVSITANTGTFALAAVNIDVGTFGDSTHIGQFTVNAKGLITAVNTILISGVSPGGPAGGDLSGSYPNPTVAKINTVPLGSTIATSGNVLIASGTQWVSQVITGDISIINTGAATLATVNSNVGTFGDSTHVSQITVNAKGLVTAAANVLINALQDPGANGIVVRTGVNTTVSRTITGTASNISVTNGNGVTGDPTINLIATAVTAASYGSATQVATFTVDAFGRLTAAANVTISGTSPGGAAGGDLSGTYPNPTVAKINTVPLGTTTATDKNLLIADGAQWVSRVVSGDLTITANTGTFTLATVNLNVGTFGDATHVGQFTVNAKGLVTAASSVLINALQDPGSNGIVVRTAVNTTVSRTLTGSANISVTNGSGVAGNPTLDLLATAVASGSYGSATQVGIFTVDSFGRLTAASNVTITGTTPGGAAGGDLSGTYPNPTVAKINTVPLGSTTATDRNILIADGTQWTSRAVSGDATITANTGTLTLATVNGNVGTFGSATQTVTITVNAKGLITAASQQTVTPAASSITGGQALTKTDDTNVTLTLGGTPATALLAATSLTMGWTGQLSLARGGSNASLVASNGGIVYSTASALAVLAGTATANQILLSGASAAPAWSTAVYPATTTINQLLYSSAANTITGLATANNGVLITDGSGVPSISTSLPSAIDGLYVLVNGTRALTGNWAAGTFSATFNSVVVGSAANTIAFGALLGGNGTLTSTTNASKGKIIFGTASAYHELTNQLTIGTLTPSTNFDIHLQKTVNNELDIISENLSTASAASGGFLARNSSKLSGVSITSINFTTSGILIADQGIYQTTGTGGMLIVSRDGGAGSVIKIAIGGLAAANEVARFTSATLTFADAINMVSGTTTGSKMGTAVTQKWGIWNATPIVQPSGATQAALTNNTAGTYDGILQAIPTVGTNLLVAASTADVNTAMAAIRNNFTDLYTQVDAIRTAMVNFGSMKGSA